MVTSIFSFSLNVFKSLLPQGCLILGFCGNGLNVCSDNTIGGVENIVGKGESAGYQHFSFSQNVLQNSVFKDRLRLGLCSNGLKQQKKCLSF